MALATALGVVAVGPLRERAAASERLHFSANVIGLGTVDCAHPQGPRTLTGAVAQAGRESFVIDSRSPLADGSALPSTFIVHAPGFPGFEGYLALGAFVRIELEVRRQGGACAQRILIQGVETWEGQPSAQHGRFFFAGNDGLWAPFAAAPFTVTLSRTDCTQIAAFARSDGKPLNLHRLSAPHSDGACNDDAWSYWVASAPSVS